MLEFAIIGLFAFLGGLCGSLYASKRLRWKLDRHTEEVEEVNRRLPFIPQQRRKDDA